MAPFPVRSVQHLKFSYGPPQPIEYDSGKRSYQATRQAPANAPTRQTPLKSSATAPARQTPLKSSATSFRQSGWLERMHYILDTRLLQKHGQVETRERSICM